MQTEPFLGLAGMMPSLYVDSVCAIDQMRTADGRQRARQACLSVLTDSQSLSLSQNSQIIFLLDVADYPDGSHQCGC